MYVYSFVCIYVGMDTCILRQTTLSLACDSVVYICGHLDKYESLHTIICVYTHTYTYRPRCGWHVRVWCIYVYIYIDINLYT